MQTKRSEKRSPGTGSIFERNGSIHLSFRPVPGKPPVQRKLCRAGALTRKEQEAKAREIISEYKPPADSEIPTFGAVGTMHIKQLELDGKRPSYTKNRWRTLRNYLIPEFGERPVDQIKVKDVNRFKTKLQQKGKGPETIKSVLWLVSGIFKEAMRNEWRTDNPVASVEMPTVEKNKVPTWLKAEEVDRVIAAIPDDIFGKVERVLYRTAQYSGIRRGEALAIRWSDFDFDRKAIDVSRNYVEGAEGPTKSHRSRTIPMVGKLKEILLNYRKVTRYPGDDDLAFGHPVTGKHLGEGTVSKRFKRALLKAKVGPVEMRPYKLRGKIVKKPFPLLKLHDLRDTFATALIMNPSISLREVQEYLGHANAATTSERYAHFMPTTDAADRMEEAFAETPAPVEEAKDVANA